MHFKKKLLKIVFTSLIIGASVDLILKYEFYVRPPSNLSKFEIKILNFLYIYSRERANIAFDPLCARHDRLLSYVLKPGNCYHSGVEFKNLYKINSLGVRDTEESLQSPEIIFLGDSHTMGWGVDQNKTFAKVIEGKTGLKTLNMGISLYAPPKELILLKRADRQKLKYLVIQYNDDDYWPTYNFTEFRFKIFTEEAWRNAAQKFESRRRAAFLGSHFIDVLNMIFQQITTSKSLAPYFKPTVGILGRTYMHKSVEDHVRNLNIALERQLPSDLKETKKIIFLIRNELHPDESFYHKFAKTLSLNNPNQLTIINMGHELNNPSKRFNFDNHINEEGHEFIANEICKTINEANK